MSSFRELLESTQRPFLGPNYWLLKHVGLILPDTQRLKIVYIMLHEVLTFFTITQYMELFVIWPDVNLMITSLKISMLSVVCIVKVNTFIIWQTSWRQILNYVTESDKFERTNEDLVMVGIINTYTKYSRRITYFYWALTFTTFFTTVTTPLIIYVSSSTFRENLRNGTENFPHIFVAYMPIDKYHSPGCWITVLWHVIMCAYGAGIMAAYDTCVVVVMVFFGGKLDLMRERCKQMFDSFEKDAISDHQHNEIVAQLSEMHTRFIKYSRLFNSKISPVMFLYVVVWAVMLCASAFQLSLATNTGQKLLMVEYIIFGITQLFMFCWHSNEVMAKHENLIMGPYESKWWAASYRQRKTALILSGQLCTKNIFTAGPFADLTLSTFVNILKGAYSYYTLIRN
ncbi:unnamed protein product [Arctia plantaginis]|uniref:Odorant receptor n=1 Tax=Arctia plantaginis TaxID=874455 RepID=A0A8S1AF44_ARCPL|nr:unnamed protein product [Arctia plantaginis]